MAATDVRGATADLFGTIPDDIREHEERSERMRQLGIRPARAPFRELRRAPVEQRPAFLAFLLRLLQRPS